MQCSEARRLLTTTRYDGAGTLLEEHLVTCPQCAAVAQRTRELDALLDADAPQEPRPGFDTRFFARLDELRQSKTARRPSWLWYLAYAGAAASITMGAVALVGRGPSLPPERDRELVANLELLEDEPLLRHLDDVEAYEVLAQVDAATLARLAGERGR